MVVFAIRFSRGSKVAKELIGKDYPGRVVSDRWSGYTWIPIKRRQICWSHLKRDFKSFLDYGPEAKHLGERLLTQRKKLFRLWHRVRDGTMTRTELQLACKSVRRQIVALLEEGESLPSAKVSGMCREMLKLKGARNVGF